MATATKKTPAKKTNKMTKVKKATAAKRSRSAASAWVAGVGAVSLARKRGEALLARLLIEGQQRRSRARKFVREARADARAQVMGMLAPVRGSLSSRMGRAGKLVRVGVDQALSQLGVPTKAEVDELAQRVAVLSRRLKSAK